MTEPLKLEDVPAELIDAAVGGWHAAPHDENGRHTVLLDDVMRNVLAAAMPSYEALVRAKVSAEILAERASLPDTTIDDRIFRTAMVLASRVALRGHHRPQETPRTPSANTGGEA